MCNQIVHHLYLLNSFHLFLFSQQHIILAYYEHLTIRLHYTEVKFVHFGIQNILSLDDMYVVIIYDHLTSTSSEAVNPDLLGILEIGFMLPLQYFKPRILLIFF